MDNTNEIYIYGSGGLGRGILDLIKAINNNNEEKWIFKGFVDDQNSGQVNGYKILGGIEFLQQKTTPINVVLAFGKPSIKKKIYEELKHNENIMFPNLVHPNVDISPFNLFGKGNIVSFGVALSSNIQIGNFNLIHYNCSVGHDVSMGDFNSVFPLTALSGFVELKDSIELGTNAAVIPGKKVGNNAKIGAGSVVIGDVSDYSTIVGVPGKEI
ncbi:transferase [Virgibacillus xinjiangensis]|uniref:Transferase n=1 Tax=Virgibacillus xinjiangensis TaxID=393090 RepID=A0ABV7CU57_9BACI